MKWKHALLSATVAVSLAMVPAGAAFANPTKNNIDTLTQVYQMLVDGHYTHPNEDKLLQAAIQGMLSEINDPFTAYMTPDEYKTFVNSIDQSYAGVGLAFGSLDSKSLRVLEVYKDTPADKAGVKAGDRIVAIDGQQVTSGNLNDAGAKIRGAAGTTVTVTLARGTDAPKDYTLTREAIELPMVTRSDLGNGIGYMRIFSFGDRTTRDFQAEFQELQKSGAKGLVLDLRGNGGGYVQSALEIADQFLSKGTIITVHDDKGEKQDITADQDASDIPITVLVDSHSASASEMLAGALQKNNRAKLVGSTSYGKGTMQVPTELPNGGYIKVSIDRWELADGKSPDKVGLTPDVRMSNPEGAEAVNAAMQLLVPDRQQVLTISRTAHTATLNGMPLQEVPAVTAANNGVYLPLRFTMEALGSEVDWSQAEQAAMFTYAGHQVKADTEQGRLLIDGQPFAGQDLLRVVDGSTYFSADALQAIVGKPVEVSDQEIAIRTK